MDHPKVVKIPKTLTENQQGKIEMELTAHPNITNSLSDVSLKEHDNYSTIPTVNNEKQPSVNNINENLDNLITMNYDENSLEHFNVYHKKKNVAQGLMDIALLSANSNQLANILNHFDHSYFSYICLVLLLTSLILQIVVGITMLLNFRRNITKTDQRVLAIKYDYYNMIGIFLITVINVLIPAFTKSDTNSKPLFNR